MSDNGNTVLGILAGTAVGAVLGILFAPDKGSKTRQRIADQATLAKENIEQAAVDLKDKAVSTAASKKQTLDEKVDSIVLDASHKADEVISTLEKKLAELKAKNKEFQKSS